MAAIFPPADKGGVPPGSNVVNGYSPGNPVLGEGPLYVGPDCSTILTDGQMNAIVSEILAAVDELGFAYNSTRIDNLGQALRAIIEQINIELTAKVNRAGDTMTGTLVLAGDPVNPLDAATKQYVDSTDLTALLPWHINHVTGSLTSWLGYDVANPFVSLLQVNTTGNNVSLNRFVSSPDAGASLTFTHPKSDTIGTNAANALGDQIGQINFNGSDGSDYSISAMIVGRVDDTPSSGNVPVSLRFYTAPSGGAVVPRMTVASRGNVMIGPGVPEASVAGLEVYRDATGAATMFGALLENTVQPDVTAYRSVTAQPYYAGGVALNAYMGFQSTSVASPSEFTISSYYNFYAGGPPAGKTTSAYDFYSASPAGTTSNINWGLYVLNDKPSYMGGSLGIGTSSVTSTGGSSRLRVHSSITGAATAYGAFLTSHVQPDVTANAYGVYSYLSADANVSLAQLIHFAAATAVKDASASITNEYGFYAGAGLNAGNTAIGFYGNVPNAANRWNFFGASAAPNYFGGDVGIHTNGYLNFGTSGALGTGGYGLRDNAGVIERKNSGGTWLPLTDTTGNVIQPAPQCGRLVYVDATHIALKPFKGADTRIAGRLYQIPSGGVTLTNAGLAANTLYFIYEFLSGTVIALTALTTGHVMDTTAGNVGTEVASNNAAYSLVGMVYTNASGQFQDSPAVRGVASWFNRRRAVLRGAAIVDQTTASTTFVEANAAARVYFLSWASEATTLHMAGLCYQDTANGYIEFGIAVDSTAALTDAIAAHQPTNPNHDHAVSYSTSVEVSEALHFGTMLFSTVDPAIGGHAFLTANLSGSVMV